MAVVSRGADVSHPPDVFAWPLNIPFSATGWLQRNAVGAVGVRLGAASVAPLRGRCLSSRRRLGGNVYLPGDRALSITPGERLVPLSFAPLHIFTPAAPETGRAYGQTRRAGVDAERSRERNHVLVTVSRAMRSGLAPRNPRSR